MSFRSEESLISNQTFGKDASFKLSQLRGSLSISPSGRDICLGSKEGLHIIDLDSPYSPPRFLPHRTSWEVADVQWSPFAERDSWVASTSNQKALVWNLNLGGWRNSIEFVLHAHTRAITDINFSAHHPDKLATCAVDSFVHCWDLRSPERPALSFSDWFAGATQVKWNRQDEHIIASAHDKYLHIWDDRFGACPARTIEAHNTKIYGIDWNRFEPSKIVTCSLDRTVKFWDTRNADDNTPERVIETEFPVWRARHTPFGWGLMVMPQRGSGDLYLYDRRAVNGTLESGHVKPVHIFPSHKGQVKEFLWRFYGTVRDGIDHRDFQLVSWGTDQELRLHAVSRDTFESVGYEKGVSRPHRLRFTRRGAKYRTFRDEPTEQDLASDPFGRADSFPSSTQMLRSRGRYSNSAAMNRWQIGQIRGPLLGAKGRRNDMHGKGAGRPETDAIAWMKNVKIASWDTDALADEITQIGEKFKHVEFETIDLPNRRATMSMQSFWGDQPTDSVYTRVEFKFPKDYPQDAHATITVQKTNSISTATQQNLTRDSRKIADTCQSKGRGCMESIVRFLLKERTVEQTINLILRDSLSNSRIIEAANLPLDGSDDSDDDPLASSTNAVKLNANFNVPHAKGCAALWSEDGRLVCFFEQKANEPASLLANIGTGNLDESGSTKLFGGFGKFQTNSPSRKVKDQSAPANDGSSGDETDDSSLFSSGSSTSESSFGLEKRTRVVPWQSNTVVSLQRTRSVDGSQNSNVVDSSKLARSTTQATLRIFDLSHLLGSNKHAAQEYLVEGSWPEIIVHNRQVSSKYNLQGAVVAWGLAISFLKPTHLAQKLESKSAESLVQNADNLWQLLEIMPSILLYLETHADVQMLAIISWMFLKWQNASLARAPQMRPRRVVSMPDTSNHGRISGNAFGSSNSNQGTFNGSSVDAFESPSKQVKSGNMDPKFNWSEQTLDILLGHSGNSGNRTQSSSATPSVIAHDPSGTVSTVHSSTVSLAGSPESSRISRIWRPTAAATTLYSRIRSRPSSPPNISNRSNTSRLNVSSKSARASPDDNFLGEAKTRLRTSLSLANVSEYGINNINTGRGDNSRDNNTKDEDSSAKRPRRRRQKLKTRLTLPEQVEVDRSSSSTAHFDTLTSSQKCMTYLRNYLPLLESWGLWLQKADALRLLAETEDLLHFHNDGNDDDNDDEGNAKRRDTDHRGLAITLSCHVCEQELPASRGSHHNGPLTCKSPQCRTQGSHDSVVDVCAICETVTSPGLVIPCLKCRHTVCFDCGEAWYGDHLLSTKDKGRLSSTTSSAMKASETADTITCPTGCGCNCAAQMQDIIVPTLPIVTIAEDRFKAPATPHSEGYQDSDSQEHLPGSAPTRTHRGQSVGGHNVGLPESAIHALLALQNQNRHRSTSSNVVNPSQNDEQSRGKAHRMRTRENSVTESYDESLPKVAEQYPALRRTLSNKGSDSTIRKFVKR